MPPLRDISADAPRTFPASFDAPGRAEPQIVAEGLPAALQLTTSGKVHSITMRLMLASGARECQYNIAMLGMVKAALPVPGALAAELRLIGHLKAPVGSQNRGCGTSPVG